MQPAVCMGEDHKENSLSTLVVLKAAEMEVLGQSTQSKQTWHLLHIQIMLKLKPTSG